MTTLGLSRRRFQFSLSSLFWLTSFAATAVFAYRERQERVRLEEELYPPTLQSVNNSVTIGLSAPGVIGSGLDVPFSQDESK